MTAVPSQTPLVCSLCPEMNAEPAALDLEQVGKTKLSSHLCINFF